MRASQPKASPYYSSERAWLDHLRLMGELPYPSWLLIPSISQVFRAHLDWDLLIASWIDHRTRKPVDIWVDPILSEPLRRYVANIDRYTQDIAIPPMLETRGRIYRDLEVHPDYEKSEVFREFFTPYGARWGMTTAFLTGADCALFLGFFRHRDKGRYTDANQNRIDKVGKALSDLDRPHNPLSALPAAPFRESATATLLFNADGTLLAHGDKARDILFLARHTGMNTPEWTHDDWSVLPAGVCATLRQMAQSADAPNSIRLEEKLPWGSYDFVLEKLKSPNANVGPSLNVVVRQHEPQDIVLARKLWGWPLSPQEKRILIASARNPSRAQLAEALGLAEGTLKEYINEIQGRMGVASRQELIERVLNQR